MALPAVHVQTYSLRHNFQAMGWAFSHPRWVTAFFLSGPGLAYGLVPLAVSEFLYTSLGWRVYRSQADFGLSLNPFARLFQLNPRQMALLQIPAHPLMAIVDAFLFAFAAYGLGKLLQIASLDIKRLCAFFLFLWGTFSIAACLIDTLVLFAPGGLSLDFLLYFHHLAALAGITYLIAFIRRQAGVNVWRAAAFAIPLYALVLASRLVFMP